MPLNDWQDVLDARKAADQVADRIPDVLKEGDAIAFVSAGLCAAQALRLEIRCLGVTISHALDEAIRAGR